ncbi:thioredoxin-like protein [Morchella snyderi]|nr:thioredoxin-like protein [Morchella snyderi]
MKGFGSFFAAFSLLAVAQASNVLDLTPKNFDKEILQSGKPALVEFFAPWCGHCKTLAPIYEQLADSFANQKDKITIAKVDADNHKSLGQRFGVKGFPTLKWFDGKSDQPIPYESKRDLESLQAFISEQMGVKPKAKKEAPSDVKTVTDSNFSEVVLDESKDVLVKFYAPWCGHCKALAPTWETLATNFKEESNVVVAKINCDSPSGKASAEKYGVSSYPTLKWFPKGSTVPVDYEYGRTEEHLTEFINDNAGTHRAVGGGLKETAGRVKALDEIVAKIAKGKEASFVKEVEDAVKGLEDKYASYYARVLAKVAKNADYVEKELNRLQGMITKNGLIPSKRDDLTIRQNILKQFYLHATPEVVTPEEQAEVEAEAKKEVPVKDEL